MKYEFNLNVVVDAEDHELPEFETEGDIKVLIAGMDFLISNTPAGLDRAVGHIKLTKIIEEILQ